MADLLLALEACLGDLQPEVDLDDFESAHAA
jgi:hypothetical protein